MRRRLPAIALTLAAVLAGALALAGPATAHPLGNLSTNQLAQVRFDERDATVHYVLDLAEIPAFQQIQRFDRDGSGAIEAGEEAAVADRLIAAAASGLELTADGKPVALRAPDSAELSFPPGQGGLATARLEADFEGTLPRPEAQVEVMNDAFAGTQGWRAIQVLPGESSDVTSDVPSSDPTEGLRSYPEDLLESPLDQRQGSFTVAPGTGTVTAPDGPEGDGGATTDRSQDGFADALAGGETAGLAILLLLGAAFGWGALHALSPGHGKAMVAGYLVGARGTPRHAVILGATVTVTHTASVFALGLVTLFASEYVLPEQLYPWLGVVSGLMVIAIGFWVMRSRLRRWRAMRAPHDHSHEHAHHHHHHHGHDHGHHHHPAPDEPITMRGLIALGVSGGLIPCPSALVVLVAAISQHRIGLGMLLIFAFSLGLAATLTAIGLAVIWGGRILERVRPERRLFGGRLTGALPAVSAIVIVLAGLLITARAISDTGVIT
jgi:ABC-type nickel/cobalt efflux system permease component RcnA